VGTVTERVVIDVDEYTVLELIPQHELAGSGVLPVIRGVAVTPGVIAPGEGLGIRESVTVQCADTQWDIAGTDYESGTLWPKVRAIYGTLRGRRLRYTIAVDGVEETRHYLVDSLSVTSDGATITARDDLWTLTSSIARAPDPSPGRLLVELSHAGPPFFTLTPAGVGDAFYRASGAAVIGGRECVEYTRVGDVMTLSARELHGTVSPDEHEADSSVQEILEFNMGGAHDVSLADFNAAGLEVPTGFTWHGGRPAEILAYLLVRYGNTDPSVIPLASWYAELDRNYSARVAQPEGVGVLIGELIQQAGLVVWTDTVVNRINMRALINVSGEAPVGTDRYYDYTCRDQPEKQVTELWAWWGQVDPTQKVDEKKNYRAIQLRVAGAIYPELDGDDNRHIRSVMCRWIHTQANAEWLGSMMVARYAFPPRDFALKLHRSDPAPAPSMAQRIALSHWSLQSTLGDEQPVLAQVIGIRPMWNELHYQLEELDLRALQTDQNFARVVYLIHGTTNTNLRTLHDIQYAAPESGQHVLFIVESGTTVGGAQLGVPSVSDGTWPAGVTHTLWVQPGGKILGRGGAGQHAQAGVGSTPEPGGDALLVTQAGIVIRNQGQIAGGGGGGGAVVVGAGLNKPGAGGSGYLPGQTGGTDTPFGEPLPPAPLGQPGAPGTQNPGGAAGRCVVGYSFVTWEEEGELTGPIAP
jgi:hypothetical protein